MTVEIKELIIRANIVDRDDNNLTPQTGVNSEQQEAIIAASVAQVLKILKRKQER